MVVKRTKTGKPRKKKLKKTAMREAQERVDALDIQLPTELSEPDRDIRRYSFMIYGRPGWGKTKLFSTFPEAAFMCPEQGAKGLKIFEFNKEHGGVTDWYILERCVEVLEEDTDLFHKNVILDGARAFWEMCARAYIEGTGIERLGLGRDGKSDFGRSYGAVNQEFVNMCQRILRTGRGLGLTAHAKTSEVDDPDGTSHNYIHPNLGNSALEMMTAFVDFGFFGEIVKDKNGRNIRVLVTEGNEAMWGKHRELEDVVFPEVLPVPYKTSGFNVIRSAFLGKGAHLSLSLDDIRAGTFSSKALQELLEDREMKAARKGKGKRRKGGVVRKKISKR